MKQIGVLATIGGILILLGGTVLLIRSVPEIKRYFKVRNM